MRVLFATLFIVITDQVTKLLVKGGILPFLNLKVRGMQYGESINVIGNFFKITFVENPGIAFGIDVNGTSKLLLSLFSLAASIGILYYLWKSRDQRFMVRLALAFILGGAIGNLIDRTFYGLFYGYAPVFYGRVVDFFNVDFFRFTIFGRTYERWPIFNIADAAVTVGVIFLLFFHRAPAEEPKPVLETAAAETSKNELNAELPKNEGADLDKLKSSANDGQNSNREEDKN